MTASFQRPPTAQEAVLAQLRQWIAAAPQRKGNVKLEVDVDPQSFL